MIAEYYRPSTVEEALELLANSTIHALPLGGGSALPRTGSEPLAVVDLQGLGMDRGERQGNSLEVGATMTLQRLLEWPELPKSSGEALRAAIRQEASYNLRQTATVAGTLVAADGRSPFTTAILALDAAVELKKYSSADETLGLGDLLYDRKGKLPGRLITGIILPSNARLAYQVVARTPADRPIVCAAVARWPSGRTRVVLGGHGPAPVLVIDGPEAGGAEAAGMDAYSNAEDEWASAEYRREVAGILVRRCMQDVLG